MNDTALWVEIWLVFLGLAVFLLCLAVAMLKDKVDDLERRLTEKRDVPSR